MALDLDAVRAFLTVAGLSSFTRAGAQLGLSKSRVSLLVAGLERQLGSKLLQRTTRTVQLTADGEQFKERAERLVTEVEELESLFSAPSSLRGRLRFDLPVGMARDRVIPRLPEFLAMHPNLEVQVSSSDRRVDLLREGFDCVVRVGALSDSSLQARRLGQLAMINVASAAYVVKYGNPKTLEELAGHFVVHYSTRLDAERPAFEYRDGARYRDLPMRALVTVNNVDAYQAACTAGLGIVQVPRSAMRAGLVSGALVEVLPQFPGAPLPVSLVHAYGRAAPKRVRALMDWLSRVLAPYLATAG
jgi:DNA-binding transcriptional LysR family regulator